MESYAVLFNREFIGKDNEQWLLKPIDVVEGNYDIDKELFMTKNKIIKSIDNMDIINSKEIEYVGTILKKEDILNYYKVNTIEEAKKRMLDSVNSIILVGHYDDVVSSITYNTLEISYLKKNVLALFECQNKTESQIEKALNNYKKWKEKLGYDFSLITSNDLENINNISSYNELKAVINFLLFAKEEYSFKILDVDKIYFVPDFKMNEILNCSTFTQMKKALNSVISNSCDNMFDKLVEPEVDEISVFIEVHESIYDEIMEERNLKKVKEKLNDYLQLFYEDLNDILDNKSTQTYPKFFEFTSNCIKELEDLLDINDLELLKENFSDFHFDILQKVDSMEEEIKKYYADDFDDLEDDEEFNDDKLNPNKETKEAYTKHIFNYNEVKDKMISRVIGRDIQIDRILTTIERNDKLKNLSKRQAMIIAGTTGTGKTQTFSELKNALSNIRPVNIVDTNQLTEEGYVGGTIEDNVLASLIIDAHRINSKNKNSNTISNDDIQLARHGIVILDEIDKRAEVGDVGNVNKSGVVNQILKLMDPNTKYMVNINRQVIEFDTSNLTIFASGAFQEYFDDLDKPKNSYGFNETETKKKNLNDYKKYQEVDPLELVKYGLDRQFVGRFNRVTLFPSHTKESLLELENNKATSNIQVEIDNYKEYGISFVWEDGYIEEVVKRAYDMKTGGRALNNIIARSLGTLNTEVNNHKDEIKTIFVPISSIDDTSKIVLIDKNNNPILLGNLIKETEKRNLSLRQANNIERDNESYNNALSIYKKMQSDDEKVKVLIR